MGYSHSHVSSDLRIYWMKLLPALSSHTDAQLSPSHFYWGSISTPCSFFHGLSLEDFREC